MGVPPARVRLRLPLLHPCVLRVLLDSESQVRITVASKALHGRNIWSLGKNITDNEVQWQGSDKIFLHVKDLK